MKVTVLFAALLPFSCGLRNPAARAAGAGAHSEPALGSAQGPNQNLVTCESNNGKRNFCPIGDPRQSVQMVRQMSNTACVQGQTWGNDNRGVWGGRGWRGRFGGGV